MIRYAAHGMVDARPTSIGRYEVLGELGAGGMGKVRLAKSPGGQVVVIKSALGESADDDERLRDEARVGLRLSHPGVVETLDLFEADGRPHLVVAFVSGASVLDLRRAAALHPVVVCRIGRQIAEALEALHTAADEHGRPLGILHRDVTPGNVMLGHDGNARLIDLGIARSNENRAARTSTGCLRGTLRYLSPELFDNKAHSAQSDLWALGVVLWEALLGRTAIRGSEAECVGKILAGRVMMLEEGEAPDPKVQKIIAQLLAKKPQDRPARARDAAAMFAMLEKEYGDSEGPARAAVVAAVGPPRLLSGDDRSRENLVANAAATFCAPEIQLLPTGFIDVRASDLVALRKAGPETERLAVERPQLAFGDVSTVIEASALVASPSPPPRRGPPSPPPLTSQTRMRTADEKPRADAAPPRTSKHGFITAEMTTPADKLKAYAAMLQQLDRTPPPAPSPLPATVASSAAALADPVVVGTALDEPPPPPTTAERRLAEEHRRAGQRLLVGVAALLVVTAIGVAATLLPGTRVVDAMPAPLVVTAAPACFDPAQRQAFLFHDDQKGLVTATSLDDVPADQRAGAKCVPLK